jgi:outer membrane protein TolC
VQVVSIHQREWELNILGKQAAAINSSEAGYPASEVDYQGARVSPAAEVASSNLTLRSLQSEYQNVGLINLDLMRLNIPVSDSLW